jgi:hypothetical protein
MPIKMLVFSKDRPMQLDAVLRSFFLHCSDAWLAQVNVLYLASSERTLRQYNCLQTDFPSVRFVMQDHFHQDVLQVLYPFSEGTWKRWWAQLLAWPVSYRLPIQSFAEQVRRKLMKRLIFPLISILTPRPGSQEFVLFCVDDNLFVRPFSLAQVTKGLQENSDALGFSLRLGRNTNSAYMVNSTQVIPEFDCAGEVCRFDWPNAEHDFHYPFEISSSLYRTVEIIPLVNAVIFENPNMLEGAMAVQAYRYQRQFPRLMCFKTSVAFCNPVNVVQTVEANNRSGHEPSNSIEILSEKFEQGERIDVEAYIGFVPNACHQEVALKFRKVTP